MNKTNSSKRSLLYTISLGSKSPCTLLQTKTNFIPIVPSMEPKAKHDLNKYKPYVNIFLTLIQGSLIQYVEQDQCKTLKVIQLKYCLLVYMVRKENHLFLEGKIIYVINTFLHL